MSNNPLKLGKYSVGTGDRFAHQAKAQLQACVQALAHGIEVIPVWNKSNREHTIIGSEPASARQAADAAVKALAWAHPYFLDDPVLFFDCQYFILAPNPIALGV